MAYELKAVLRLQDKLTAPLKRAVSSLDRTKKVTDQVSGSLTRTQRAANATGSAFRRMDTVASRSFSSISRGSGGVIRSVLAIGAAYLTARGAVSLFDATIGSAARREVSEVTVSGLFKGDTSKAKEYFDYVDKRAAISMFKQDDFLNTGKAFIPVTKDLAQLKTMTSLAERLAASNPEQGLSGAAFALRELFSGDIMSLADRFNLTRKSLNDIKTLPLAKQLVALDTLLNDIGYSEKLLTDQANTGLAQWEQATDKVSLALQDMGKDALEKIKPLLFDINKMMDGKTFKAFEQAGSRAMAALARSTADNVTKAGNYINRHFINNPEFTNLPTVSRKFEFIVSEFKDTYDTWYAAGGKTQIENAAKSVTDFLGETVGTLSQPLLDAGVKLGKELGKGLLTGLEAFSKDHPILTAGLTFVATPGPLPVKTAAAAAVMAQGYTNKAIDAVKENSIIQKTGDVMGSVSKKLLPSYDFIETVGTFGMNKVFDKPKPDGSFAGGLSRVPYDGFRATLHKDETVLTASEAEARHNGGGVSLTVGTINVNGGGSTKETATEILREILRQANEAVTGGALANG